MVLVARNAGIEPDQSLTVRHAPCQHRTSAGTVIRESALFRNRTTSKLVAFVITTDATPRFGYSRIML